MKAGDAETLGGLPISAFVLAGEDWHAAPEERPASSDSVRESADDGPIGNAMTTHDDVHVVNSLGVGTANALQKFVVSDNGGVGFELVPSGQTVIIQSYDRAGGNYGNLRFNTSSNGTTMSLNKIGNVGIGTIWATSKLQVIGTVDATAFVGSGAGLTNVAAVYQ